MPMPTTAKARRRPRRLGFDEQAGEFCDPDDEVVGPFDSGAAAGEGFDGVGGGDAAQDGEAAGFGHCDFRAGAGWKRRGRVPAVDSHVRPRRPRPAFWREAATRKPAFGAFAGLLAGDGVGGGGLAEEEGVPDGGVLFFGGQRPRISSADQMSGGSCRETPPWGWKAMG